MSGDQSKVHRGAVFDVGGSVVGLLDAVAGLRDNRRQRLYLRSKRAGAFLQRHAGDRNLRRTHSTASITYIHTYTYFPWSYPPWPLAV